MMRKSQKRMVGHPSEPIQPNQINTRRLSVHVSKPTKRKEPATREALQGSWLLVFGRSQGQIYQGLRLSAFKGLGM